MTRMDAPDPELVAEVARVESELAAVRAAIDRAHTDRSLAEANRENLAFWRARTAKLRQEAEDLAAEVKGLELDANDLSRE